ncbi:MAG: ABC transporter permease [Acidimicrobiia bacterium]
MAPVVEETTGEVTGRWDRLSPRTRRIVSAIGVVLTLVAVWELYKLIWSAFGWINPVRPDDVVMPHVWDMVIELFRPVRRGGNLLILDLSVRALWTLREAILGFLIGGALGFGIGVWFVRSRLAEQAFMPYVVASQTVPFLAIAPMVVVWGLGVGIPGWISVAIIAAYLTFFPVAINTLRGLRSPDPNSLELMRSYAAAPREVLWKLQVPSALPYIFTALKVTATASIVGALVGELPVGFQSGLGRALLTFSQQFAVQSKKLYGTVIVCALVGILFVGLVSYVERKLVPQRMSRDEVIV